MSKWIDLLAVLSFFVLAGCSDHEKAATDPKLRLNEYISKSFNAKSIQDKDEMMGYLTGEARVRLSGWSEDQFREAFIDSKREFLKLAFKEINPVSPDETNITYEISYLDKARGSKVKVTNKKMSRMVHESGKWMIRDVQNIRELIEYQNEMSLP